MSQCVKFYVLMSNNKTLASVYDAFLEVITFIRCHEIENEIGLWNTAYFETVYQEYIVISFF